MKRLFLISMLVCLCIVDVAAQGTKRTAGFETRDRFMPTSRRVDRQIDGNVFAYKGEWALGLTASYGTLLVICPKCGKPTRIGHVFIEGEGKASRRKRRVCKQCKAVFDN